MPYPKMNVPPFYPSKHTFVLSSSLAATVGDAALACHSDCHASRWIKGQQAPRAIAVR